MSRSGISGAFSPFFFFKDTVQIIQICFKLKKYNRPMPASQVRDWDWHRRSWWHYIMAPPRVTGTRRDRHPAHGSISFWTVGMRRTCGFRAAVGSAWQGSLRPGHSHCDWFSRQFVTWTKVLTPHRLDLRRTWFSRSSYKSPSSHFNIKYDMY